MRMFQNFKHALDYRSKLIHEAKEANKEAVLAQDLVKYLQEQTRNNSLEIVPIPRRILRRILRSWLRKQERQKKDEYLGSVLDQQTISDSVDQHKIIASTVARKLENYLLAQNEQQLAEQWGKDMLQVSDQKEKQQRDVFQSDKKFTYNFLKNQHVFFSFFTSKCPVGNTSNEIISNNRDDQNNVGLTEISLDNTL